MKRRLLILAVSIAALHPFVSCNRDNDTAAEPIAPVYKWFAANGDFSQVPDSLRSGVDAMMAVLGHPDPTEVQLTEWASSAPVRVFTPAVDSVFPSLSGLERQLGHILARADAEGLELPHRSYAAVVWGRPQSVVFADGVMLVALNHYLGADYGGYGSFPAYQRATKTPQALPYDMCEALVATSYVFDPADDCTVLSHLLYNGALVEAKMRLVAGADLAVALGYDEGQMRWVEENENLLWKNLVGAGLLFDTSQLAAMRLTAPSPATRILVEDAPGRVGRYLGYRIVKSYVKRHPEAALSFLLSPDFYAAGASLAESGYKPGV